MGCEVYSRTVLKSGSGSELGMQYVKTLVTGDDLDDTDSFCLCTYSGAEPDAYRVKQLAMLGAAMVMARENIGRARRDPPLDDDGEMCEERWLVLPSGLPRAIIRGINKHVS